MQNMLPFMAYIFFVQFKITAVNSKPVNSSSQSNKNAQEK